MKIEELLLTARSHNGLKAAGIDTVEQLVKLSLSELEVIPNLGNKSFYEISWMCMKLMEGKLTDEILRFNNLFPPENKDVDFDMLLFKAGEYDKIVKIINSKGWRK